MRMLYVRFNLHGVTGSCDHLTTNDFGPRLDVDPLGLSETRVGTHIFFTDDIQHHDRRQYLK